MRPAELSGILNELHQGLVELVGDQLAAIYLYGSQARGKARDDADIDVLVVLKEDFDYFEMLEKTSALIADLSLHNDVVLSRVFVTEKQYAERGTPLLMNVHKEGVRV